MKPQDNLMKTRFNCAGVILALVMALVDRALAADSAPPISPLEGSWRWSFTNADGGVVQPTLRVTTTDDGTLVGISRFRQGASVPITNLTVKGNQISFQVIRARDGNPIVTRYDGTLRGDEIKGFITSGSLGDEKKYDWSAARFSEIEGVWKWRFTGFGGGGGAGAGNRRGGQGTATLALKREEGEKLSGKLRLGRFEQEVESLNYRNGDLSFHTIRERSDGSTSTNYYSGKFSRENIKGKYTSDFGGVHRTNDWHATRAE